MSLALSAKCETEITTRIYDKREGAVGWIKWALPEEQGRFEHSPWLKEFRENEQDLL